MQSLVAIIPVLLANIACTTNASIKKNNNDFIINIPKSVKSAANKSELTKDTLPLITLAPYSDIEYEKKELLTAAKGTKSVLFNTNGSRLYAMNLEGMSVYEFDQSTRKVIKEFKFKPTKGTGWDYEKDKPIPSYEEKPVEACITHNDKILWVSLHNAEGIVPIKLDSAFTDKNTTTKKGKKITVVYPGLTQKDSFYVPLIKTGKTPKINC
jgi:hypothetical protein